MQENSREQKKVRVEGVLGRVAFRAKALVVLVRNIINHIVTKGRVQKKKVKT